MKKHSFQFCRAFPVTVLAALGASTLIGVIQPVLAEPTGSNNRTEKRGGRQGGKHNRMEKMAKELGLTATQKTRLQAIMTQTRSQSKAVRDNKSLSQTQKREKVRAIHQASRQRMSDVLTTEQRNKLMAMKTERRGGKDRPMRRKM